MRNQIIWSAPSKPDPSRSNEKWLIDTVNAGPNVGNRWLGNQLGASKAAVNIRICSLRKAGVITVRRDPKRLERHAAKAESPTGATGGPQRMDAPGAGATVRVAVELNDEDLARRIHGQLRRKDGRQHTIGRLADQFNVPPKRIRTAIRVLNDGCYMTRTVQDVVFLADEPVGNSWSKVDSNVFFHKEIVFGALSDTHLCNKQERLEVLHGIYDIFERQGVRVVYHAGNYVDGEARFNKQELLVHGMGNQIKYFVANYPKRDGITTYYVAGDDHEGWWQQREGIEIGRYTQMEAEAAGRYDLKYLGYMEHDVVIQGEEGRAILRVVHPGGGSAYAISYTSQKLVESYSGGEKPNILLLGHYHKVEYLPGYRNVHSFQTGCVCFTGNTRIETDMGRKAIRDIEVGDMVLTHKGRYRPVTRLYKRKHTGGFVTLSFGRKNRMDNRITGTPEHPVLVERDGVRLWLPMSEVEVGDTVFVAAKDCPITGDRIPYWLKMSRFANPAQQESVRVKISQARGGFRKVRGNGGTGLQHLENDILPFCDQMAREGWVMVPVGAVAIPDAIGFKDGKVVAFELERRQGNVLDYKKAKYEGAYILRYIDEVRWIDVNGPFESASRYPWYEADTDTGFCKVKVVEKTVKPSYSDKRSQATVYNIEVDEDNSYVASHVVVHNCGQSTFMRKKRLAADIGAWIIRANQAPDGSINRVQAEWIGPWYDREWTARKWCHSNDTPFAAYEHASLGG